MISSTNVFELFHTSSSECSKYSTEAGRHDGSRPKAQGTAKATQEQVDQGLVNATQQAGLVRYTAERTGFWGRERLLQFHDDGQFFLMKYLQEWGLPSIAKTQQLQTIYATWPAAFNDTQVTVNCLKFMKHLPVLYYRYILNLYVNSSSTAKEYFPAYWTVSVLLATTGLYLALYAVRFHRTRIVFYFLNSICIWYKVWNMFVPSSLCTPYTLFVTLSFKLKYNFSVWFLNSFNNLLLRYFASGNAYTDLQCGFWVAPNTYSLVVGEVSQALIDCYPEAICAPDTEQGWK